MEEAELVELFHDIESDRSERTESSDGDKIRQAVCAFANDMPNHRRPGVIFVGVRKDGSCANLEIDDDLLLKLAHVRDDGNINPLPTIKVQKKTIANCEFALVEVEPSDYTPVRYKGNVWIRVGPRRAIATPQEERILTEKRRSKDLPFDMLPVEAATTENLDLDFFAQVYLPAAVPSETIERNTRSINDQLAAFRFVTSVDPAIPTVTGILTLSYDPTEFIPSAYVQFVRVEGSEITNPIKDQTEISGLIFEVLEKLDEKFNAHNSVSADFTSNSREIKSPDYPIVAFQQIVRNAIMHRNYEGTNAPVHVNWFDDRIEIHNPGGPYGNVTKENFGDERTVDYRNPNLAAALKDLGYVQRFGFGIATARAELRKNSNPELEFFVEDNHVLAILKKK